MANQKDYYQILGVNKSATDAEIKSAYRKLARTHHPDIDKSAGAADKFKEISEAYQILSNPEKRKMYDQFGSAAFSGGAGGNPFAGGDPFGGFGGFRYSAGQGGPDVQFDFGGFEDPFQLFETIFGGMGGGFGQQFRRRPTYQLEVSFDESVKGVTKEVEVPDENGKKKRLTIKIPAGVDNGTRMRFDDIEIVFRVKSDPKFIREGSSIVSEKILTIPQLVLGDVVEVETVWDKVSLKIPAGTEPGSLIRIKGKGMPNLSGGKGDHYLRVKLDMPKNVSGKEKELYQELANLKTGKKKGWF